MMLMKMKNIDEPIKISPGKITTIRIENLGYLYELLFEFYHGDFSQIIFSKDFEPIEANKIALFVPSLLDLDLNTKKILNQTYKYISEYCNNDKVRQQLSSINKEMFSLLDEVIYNFDGNVNYSKEATVIDVLNIGNVRYVDNGNNFVERFVLYIKNVKNLSNFNILIVNDLFKFLKENEIHLLIKEIEILNVHILNIEGKGNFIDKDSIILDEVLSQIC